MNWTLRSLLGTAVFCAALATATATAHAAFDAAWSIPGNHAAFTRGSTVYVYRADGTWTNFRMDADPGWTAPNAPFSAAEVRDLFGFVSLDAGYVIPKWGLLTVVRSTKAYVLDYVRGVWWQPIDLLNDPTWTAPNAPFAAAERTPTGGVSRIDAAYYHAEFDSVVVTRGRTFFMFNLSTGQWTKQPDYLDWQLPNAPLQNADHADAAYEWDGHIFVLGGDVQYDWSWGWLGPIALPNSELWTRPNAPFPPGPAPGPIECSASFKCAGPADLGEISCETPADGGGRRNTCARHFEERSVECISEKFNKATGKWEVDYYDKAFCVLPGGVGGQVGGTPAR